MKRVLVAEDSPTQALQMRLLLESEGFEVETAADGLKALDRLRESTFDLVVSDVVMPHMSGHELCRAIRDDPALAHLPVVLVTRLTDPHEVLSGLSIGADSYIFKSVHKIPLVREVNLLLSGDERATAPASEESRTVWLGDLSFTVRPDMDGGWVNRCVNVSGGILPLLG